jgi:tRNA threonylcarbamoyladenosine biosynthesis protein TsaB
MIGLALHDGQQILAESVWKGGRYHTVELAPETAIMLRRVGVSRDSLTAIAVTLGPGSFTGLRIGMAFAKGLALAKNLILVGVPTMEVQVWSQPQRTEPMLAVIQAGRGRIAGMWYKWGRRGWKSKGEVETLTWPELIDQLEKKTYICGEIDPEGREMLSKEPKVILAPEVQCLRRPSYLAELAWGKVRSGKISDKESMTPIYLKSPGEKSL